MKPANREAGFTLLELTVVVAILAIVAGTGVQSLDGFQADAERAVAEREMQQLRQALLHFYNDTGYFPQDPSGPFCFDRVPAASLPVYVQALPESERRAWFDSPANFWLLYGQDNVADNPNTALRENCPLDTGHPLCTWKRYDGAWEETQGLVKQGPVYLGWRGPYLSRNGEGLVDIGSNLLSDGGGSPVDGSALLDVRGVADPFQHAPASGGGSYGRCDDPSESRCLLDWRSLAGGESHDRWGRPYLYFFEPDQDVHRLVSMGADGRYDGVNLQDKCLPNGDDLVLCLRR